MNTSTQRYVWLDYVRFIGIFLVVLGHTTMPRTIINFIYLFHMPLFFIISGYLFKPEKYKSYRQFLKDKSNQLLIPYLFFSILTFLFWFFIGCKFGDDSGFSFNWYELLLSFTATTSIFYNQVLWFLLTLFATENLYYWAIKYLKKPVIFIVFIALAWAYNYFIDIELPLLFNLAIGYVSFFAFGAIIKPLWVKLIANPRTNTINLVSFALCFATEWFLFKKCENIDISMRSQHAFILAIVVGIIGSLAIFNLGALCQKNCGNNRIITFYASYTMVLYALHGQLMSVLKGCALYIFNVPISIYNNDILSNLCLVIGAFIFIYPITLLFIKYTPHLIGK